MLVVDVEKEIQPLEEALDALLGKEEEEGSPPGGAEEGKSVEPEPTEVQKEGETAPADTEEKKEEETAPADTVEKKEEETAPADTVEKKEEGHPAAGFTEPSPGIFILFAVAVVLHLTKLNKNVGESVEDDTKVEVIPSGAAKEEGKEAHEEVVEDHEQPEVEHEGGSPTGRGMSAYVYSIYHNCLFINFHI